MKRSSESFSIDTYMRWPLILTLGTLFLSAFVFVLYPGLGVLSFVISVFVAVFALYIYFSSRRKMTRWLTEFAANFEGTRNLFLSEVSVPLAILDSTGTLLWENDAFSREFESVKGGRIVSVFPDITREILPEITENSLIHSTFGERRYAIELVPADFAAGHIGDFEGNAGAEKFSRSLIFALVTDETEAVAYRKAYEESLAAEGFIYIDNYEEVLSSVEDVRRSLLAAFVERRINGYVDSFHGIVGKLEKDKYFFFVKERDLEKMIEDKFSLLDDAKGISIGNTQRVTLSIGIGRGGAEYSDNRKYANAAIELALGRGGDQAVLKEGEETVFFGGKTEAKEKHMRVKARVKAQALKDLLNTSDRLIVMGHKNPDIDCLGASIGIWRIARAYGKKAYIAIGEPNRALRPMYERFVADPAYPDDIFISGETALSRIDSGTILVVVDVARGAMTEAPELLSKTKNIVVIDHHRRAKETIEGAVLTYIEPYASSACELVSEIVQYMDMDVELTPLDADAMYGGIMIDTQNFVNQTGVRTLEAAGYLRSKGADVSRVRKLFRDSLNDFRAKADAIDRAEIYRDHFALSTCNALLADTPTVIGAQTANSLLEIDAIKAAVVLTPLDDSIYISARSIDDVNVQVMMEKLGGGGHMSVAGAQLEGISPEEAMNMVKKVIDEMLLEGDIS